MKIRKSQLRKIIREELQFPDDVLVDSDSQDYQQGYADAYDGLKMQKNQSQQYQNGWDDGHFDIIRDNEPYGSPLPTTLQKLKVGDIVRKVDYRGDGWGGDFKRAVGDEIGTVIEIDDSEDGPIQYVVNWPSGAPTMGSADEFELVNECTVKVTKRQLRQLVRETLSEARPRPHLNKYDPGSLLGHVVFLLDKEGLLDAADSVREVSRVVSQAWLTRE